MSSRSENGLPTTSECDRFQSDVDDAQVRQLQEWAASDDERVRTCAAYAASFCAETHSEAATVLEALLEDASHLVRFVAALEGALQYQISAIDPARYTAELDCDRSVLDGFAETYEFLPFFGGASLLGRYAIAIGTLAEHAFPLAPRILSLLEGPVAQEAIEIGRGLLLLTFSGEDRTFHPDFVEHLDALAKCAKFFVFSADAHEELRQWGLTEHGSLDEFVETLRASEDPRATFDRLIFDE
ncbi:MAG: hypothetical protein AAGE52_24060 [Myxococcota bacterium]